MNFPTMTQNHVMTTAFDATCDLLAGATIHGARREQFWLVLDLTDRLGVRRELHLTARTTKGEAYCGRCGEERLVEVTTDARGRHAFCNACGHKWEVA